MIGRARPRNWLGSIRALRAAGSFTARAVGLFVGGGYYGDGKGETVYGEEGRQTVRLFKEDEGNLLLFTFLFTGEAEIYVSYA